MRTILYSLILSLCSILFISCNRTEFLYSTSSFYVLNQTKKDVIISYVITNPYNHVVDSNTQILPAKDTTRLQIDSITAHPSLLFDRMLFLSQNNDTLLIISSVEDLDWEYTQGKVDYGGYMLTEHRWLYKFSK